MTHEAKRDIVARVAAGADAIGVTDIYISARTVSDCDAGARIHGTESARPRRRSSTHERRGRYRAASAAYQAAGCDTIVSLGGDGTNRAIVRAVSNVNLLALSTGTNNVFPQLLEPTIGGMIAGFVAAGRLPHARSRGARR